GIGAVGAAGDVASSDAAADAGVERQRAVRDRERDLDGVCGRIGVGVGNRHATDRERRVFVAGRVAAGQMIDRRIIDRIDRERGGAAVLLAGGDPLLAVAHRPGERAGGVVAVVGRIVASGIVLDGVERRIVVGDGVVARQRQRFGARTVG